MKFLVIIYFLAEIYQASPLFKIDHELIKNYNLYEFEDFDIKNEISNKKIDDSVLENSKIAIDSILNENSDEKKNLLFFMDSNQNEIRNLFEFIITNIVDKTNRFNKSIKQDSLNFIILLQSIFKKFKKIKIFKSMRPNFVKYLINYLNQVLITQYSNNLNF